MREGLKLGRECGFIQNQRTGAPEISGKSRLLDLLEWAPA